MNLKPIFILLAIGFVGLIGFNLFSGHKVANEADTTAAVQQTTITNAASSQDVGEKLLAEYQKTLPHTFNNGEARADKAYLEAGKVIRVQGSLLNQSFSDITTEQKAKMIKAVKEEALSRDKGCEGSDMKALHKAGYTVVYMFFDKFHNFIGEFSVTPEDCKMNHS